MGAGQTRDSYLPFFCFLFIIIYLQKMGICFCGLVSPLQGGAIETDKLDRYKGGVYGVKVSRSPFFESVFFTQSLLRVGLIRIS